MPSSFQPFEIATDGRGQRRLSGAKCPFAGRGQVCGRGGGVTRAGLRGPKRIEIGWFGLVLGRLGGSFELFDGLGIPALIGVDAAQVKARERE